MPEFPSGMSAATLFGLDPSAALMQLAGSDPRLAMLMQLMQPRRAPEQAEEENRADLLAELAAATEQLAAAEALIDRLRESGRRLLARARADEARLGDLAAALGACGLCWGDDGSCPSCRGRGRPGMVRPDPELRARLFGPPRTGPGTGPVSGPVAGTVSEPRAAHPSSDQGLRGVSHA